MKDPAFDPPRRAVAWSLVLVAISAVFFPRGTQGYTPDSPLVREMLARAIAYMETADRNGQHSSQLGGQVLMGLAAYKYQKRFGDRGDPLPRLTQLALDRVLGVARSPSALANEANTDNYSLGIALIFLTEVRPTDHTLEIARLFDELTKRQKANGAWGYAHEKRGDTSQLQYAVLSAWAAKKVGIDVSNDVMERVVNYLLRVQDPTGAWGYQGNDPGGFTRIQQEGIRPSLVAAGLGSVYVAADFLGMSKTREPEEKKTVPAALMPVPVGGKLASTAVDAQRMKQAMDDGNNWFRQHVSPQTDYWQFYYLYSLERYQSFREKVEGAFEKEPSWYNEGVRLMAKLQAPNGSWGVISGSNASPNGCDPPVATAFGALFLLRSTHDTFETVIDRNGVLNIGRDLPADLSDVRLRNNQIVTPAITRPVEDLINILENDEAEKIENMLDNPDALLWSDLAGSGRKYHQRLARILRAGSYRARIVAARTLGRQGELDNVPLLIYALTDGDPRVVKEARDGLRMISRKFEGFGLSDKPTKEETQSVTKRWKAWYKSVRPDAVFIQ